MATNKKTIFWVGGLGAAFLLWQLSQEVQNTVAGLTFRFGAGGVPKIVSLTQIEVPVQIWVDNPGFTDIPAANINISLSRITKGGSYPFAATPPQGVATEVLKSRATTRFIIPIRTEPLSAITEIFTTLSHIGGNKFGIAGTIQVGGISVPIAPVTFTT
jgi:hypothetical protein